MYVLELYILVMLQGWRLQRVRKGVVPYEAYSEVMPCCKAQWLVDKRETIKEQSRNKREA